jgi:hypothetical protein
MPKAEASAPEKGEGTRRLRMPRVMTCLSRHDTGHTAGNVAVLVTSGHA